MGYQNCAEVLEVEPVEIAGEPSEFALEYGFIDREELRMFLVACLQASVSIEAMSRYLGLDQDTVRKELRLGIEAWNTGRRHAIETIAGPHLRIAASRD